MDLNFSIKASFNSNELAFTESERNQLTKYCIGQDILKKTNIYKLKNYCQHRIKIIAV